MVKKVLLFSGLILIVGLFIYTDSDIVIPDASIRLRVIPNSNDAKDINMKLKVKEYLENDFVELLNEVKDISQARNIISDNISTIDKNINSIFLENDYKMDYKINFGNNYFPQKEFNGRIYESGMYESLVISIGEANGDNFWCVLFPNYCLGELDNDVEYHFFIKDLWKKIF